MHKLFASLLLLPALCQGMQPLRSGSDPEGFILYSPPPDVYTDAQPDNREPTFPNDVNFTDANVALWIALNKKDTRNAIAALNDGASLTAKNPTTGRNPLAQAARLGHIAFLAYLKEQEIFYQPVNRKRLQQLDDATIKWLKKKRPS